MSRTSKFRRHRVLVSLFLIMAWSLWGILGLAEAETFTGIQGDRIRFTLGFRVKPEAVQERLPAPWQSNPLASGPLKGANFLVALIDRVRDDDPEGKAKTRGTNPFIALSAPAKHPQTGQTVGISLGGFASNPASVPGFYKTYRAATIRMEQTIKSLELDAEEVTDVWEVRDAAGAGGVELRLQSLRKVGARTRVKGEANLRSAKDPALWRTYKFDAGTDLIKSVPEGIDRVKAFTFRMTAPDYQKLFDGSEQLVGINVFSWYVRQVFVR